MKNQHIYKCGIYKITNKLNGKAYIGQSEDIYTRWSQHKWHSEKNDVNYIFSNALKKYGVDNFSWEIIEECSVAQLSERERYYIEQYHTYIGWDDAKGYNMTVGGDGYTGGTIKVDQYDKNGKLLKVYSSISEAARQCDVHKTQITQCCKLNPKYRSAGGYQWRYHGDEPPSLYKYRDTLSVQQCFNNGEVVAEYPSVVEAAQTIGVSSGYIQACCNKGGIGAKGYMWRYN